MANTAQRRILPYLWQSNFAGIVATRLQLWVVKHITHLSAQILILFLEIEYKIIYISHQQEKDYAYK